VFDTLNAKLTWEHPYYPHYYLPFKELQHGEFKEVEKGDGYAIGRIRLDSKPSTEPNSIRFDKGVLAGFLKLDFGQFSWFEEDDQILGHPTDIYKRIDVRRSLRPVKIEVDGHTIAESPYSLHLYETLLPTRYYLPRTSVKWEYLQPSDTTTYCPYKGTASYFNIAVNGKVYKDLVWWYPAALQDAFHVQNLVS
jgi:uncharacterized protein (DUF427 family)